MKAGRPVEVMGSDVTTVDAEQDMQRGRCEFARLSRSQSCDGMRGKEPDGCEKSPEPRQLL